MKRHTRPIQQRSSEPSKEDLPQALAKRVGLEEFLIDFFAGLVPGLAFLSGALLALVGALLTLGTAIRRQLLGESTSSISLGESLVATLAATKETPTALWIALTAVGVLLAYVTGLFIYRLDPDRPDRYSYRRLVRSLAKQKDSKPPEYRLACHSEADCHYPYPDPDKYLVARNLKHLLPFFASSGASPSRFDSKSHLMILKTRLRFLYPDRVGSLLRIESHIRMNASMWYVAHYLERVCYFAFVLILIAAALPFSRAPTASADWRDSVQYALAATLPILVLAFSRLCRIAVERSLHYQRVRELIHIYEAAYVAFRGRHWDLCPPFSPEAFSAEA